MCCARHALRARRARLYGGAARCARLHKGGRARAPEAHIARKSEKTGLLGAARCARLRREMGGLVRLGRMSRDGGVRDAG